MSTASRRARGAAAWLAAVLLAAACGRELPTVAVALPAAPPRSLLIRDVTVLDVEHGELRPRQDVLVQRGRIAAIRPAGLLRAADAEQVLDGAGGTLLPGLVDMHAHVYASSAPTWQRALPDPEANLRAYLYAGVTTVFDPGDPSGDAVARRGRLARGELLGPRVYTAGPMLTCPDGHPIALVRAFAPWWIRWYLEPRVATALRSPEHAAEVTASVSDSGVDAVKIAIDRIPLDAPRMDPAVVRAVVDTARARGLRVVAHVGTTEDAIIAAEAGVAAWAHGVYKERIPDRDVPRLAGYGIPMIATIEVFDRYARSFDGPIVPTRLERETVAPRLLAAFHPVPDDFELGPLESWLELARETREARIENVRRLHEAGVQILAGSDTQTGVFPGAGLHRELANLERAGLTPAEAIRAATLDGARFLANGAELEFGLVEEGLRADLLLVAGDPTRDLSALQDIRAVLLGGVPVERRAVGVP